MGLQELMQQHQQPISNRTSDAGKATRMARFAELVGTAFGKTPEELEMQLHDEGPWNTWGTINYQGHEHTLRYGNVEGHNGKWWSLNGKPVFKHQGRNSPKAANLNVLLRTIAEGHQIPAQTTRLETVEDS